MADEQTSAPKSASKSKDSGKSSAPEGGGYEQATERGYVGQVAEEPPNEAYRVDADHEATAQAQRQALREQRQAEAEASGEGD
jgi:hypothetical protein